eukprot:2884414-Pleurochrysis_carterae.AAC.1
MKFVALALYESSAAGALAHFQAYLEHQQRGSRSSANKQNFRTSPRARGANSGGDDAPTPAAGAI